VTVKYFNVKNGLSTGNISLDATSGNISGTNLSVTGNSNLGAVGNVSMTGGSRGYFLSTDGNGTLSFVSPASTTTPAPMPTYVPVGTDLSISANYQGIYSVPIVVDGSLTVDGVLVQVDGIVGSSNSQIIFNDYGTTTGNANLTFNKVTGTLSTVALSLSGTANLGSVSNVKITGGTSGQYLQTDGTGNLSWTTGSGGGGTPSGSNTQVQFNDAGGFGGNSGFTFNKTTGIFTAPFLAGNGNGLSNIQGANVSGAVSYATTANSVAVANVSGIGNIATVNLTGSTSNVLYGNGSFAAISVSTSNVSGLGNIATVNLDGSSSNVLYGNGSFAAPASGAMTWSIVSSNVTMTKNNGYFVDTTAGAKTLTLPSTATLGDTVRINDLAGTFGTNNLTVARNGGNIQGVAQDLLVTVNQSSFGLVYSNSTYGWKLLEI
jgi:hypothetical protein